MKRILIILTLIGSGAAIFAAGVRYDAKIWRAVQTYDLVTLSKNLDAHMRELVGVKCNFRGKDIRHMKPNWYESSIWAPNGGERGKFAHLELHRADLVGDELVEAELNRTAVLAVPDPKQVVRPGCAKALSIGTEGQGVHVAFHDA